MGMHRQFPRIIGGGPLSFTRLLFCLDNTERTSGDTINIALNELCV